MHIVIESFIDDMIKVTALGTIAVEVFPFIIVSFNGFIKEVFSLFYLITNSRKKSELKWRTVFVY